MPRCRRSPCRSTSSRRTRRPSGSRHGPRRFSVSVGRFIQRADNYSLAVVLFATSLFFAGISTRLRSSKPQLVILGLGYTLFLAALIWVATFPISVAV